MIMNAMHQEIRKHLLYTIAPNALNNYNTIKIQLMALKQIYDKRGE